MLRNTAVTVPARNGRTRSKRDAEHRVVAALEQRGYSVRQDFAVPGAGRKARGEGVGRVDIYAERGDIRLIVEMKRSERFRTERQRGEARFTTAKPDNRHHGPLTDAGTQDAQAHR